MARKPMYNLTELADILDTTRAALEGRLKRTGTDVPQAHTLPKGSVISSIRRAAALYDKDEFLAWHKRHFSHLTGGRQQ